MRSERSFQRQTWTAEKEARVFVMPGPMAPPWLQDPFLVTFLPLTVSYLRWTEYRLGIAQELGDLGQLCLWRLRKKCINGTPVSVLSTVHAQDELTSSQAVHLPPLSDPTGSNLTLPIRGRLMNVSRGSLDKSRWRIASSRTGKHWRRKRLRIFLGYSPITNPPYDHATLTCFSRRSTSLAVASRQSAALAYGIRLAGSFCSDFVRLTVEIERWEYEIEICWSRLVGDVATLSCVQDFELS